MIDKLKKSSIHTYLGLFKLYRKNAEFARHDLHDVFVPAKAVLECYGSKRLEEVRMLDVGCGQRFSTTLLFHTLGVRVTGIDVDFIDPNFTLRGLLSVWGRSGFERFLKTSCRRFLFDRSYYEILSRKFNRPLRTKDVDVRLMNAQSLDFPTEHFDYVFSNAVLEHIDDVETVVAELARVLKAGGVAYIITHLFPSLSGGHSLEWGYPDEEPSRKVPPWDHLRQNLYPAHVYLNKMRERDFLAIFSRYFEIASVESIYEGERCLTEEIERELPSFTRDELLKRRIDVVLRKPG